MGKIKIKVLNLVTILPVAHFFVPESENKRVSSNLFDETINVIV